MKKRTDHPKPPVTGAQGKRLVVPVLLLALAAGFVGFAVWYRTSGGAGSGDDETAQDTDAGRVPFEVGAVRADYNRLLMDERATFETTCSVCHQLPSPKLYDAEGWRGIGEKMKERMAERMDVAILHLMRNAPPSVEFKPLAELESTRPATQP